MARASVRRLIVLTLAVAALAACGRRGELQPPGGQPPAQEDQGPASKTPSSVPPAP